MCHICFCVHTFVYKSALSQLLCNRGSWLSSPKAVNTSTVSLDPWQLHPGI